MNHREKYRHGSGRVNPKDIKSKGIYILPNLFTLCALFAGFYAIVAATKGLFEIAAIALFIAMLLDNLDGRIARLTNTQSAFGAELDSLSDMLAFGLAPALIIYHWQLAHLGKIGWLISFFYTATAALRLARFNSQLTKASTDKKYFKGLPAPVAAAVITGFVWNCVDMEITADKFDNILSIITALLTGLVAVLMVSNINYYSFKQFDLLAHRPYLGGFIFIVLIILIVLDPSKILFLGSLLYLLSGLLFWLLGARRRKN